MPCIYFLRYYVHKFTSSNLFCYEQQKWKAFSKTNKFKIFKQYFLLKKKEWSLYCTYWFLYNMHLFNFALQIWEYSEALMFNNFKIIYQKIFNKFIVFSYFLRVSHKKSLIFCLKHCRTKCLIIFTILKCV